MKKRAEVIVQKVIDEKTVKVGLSRIVRHRIYKKTRKVSKSYLVSSAGFKLLPGQLVEIEQTRPISKKKTFKIVKIIKK